MLKAVPVGASVRLPASFHHLIQSTADLLDLEIEVCCDSECIARTSGMMDGCAACSRGTQPLYQACRSRQEQALGSRGNETPEQWVCPHGREITVLPVETRLGPSPRLVVIRKASADDAPAPRRAREMRFLSRLTQLLSEQIDLAGELSTKSADLSQSHRELDLLYTISGRVSEAENVRKSVREILAKARTAVGADAAFAFIGARSFFEVAAPPSSGSLTKPGDASPDKSKWRRLAERIASQLEDSDRRFFSGTGHDLGLHNGQVPPTDVLAVRMVVEDGLQGILGLVHRRNGGTRRADQVRLLESLSDRVGLTIANNELYEDLKEFLMATVKSLVSAIEAKDSYTSGHSERVQVLSMLLGHTLGLDPAELEVLKWASILHDIGKIGMAERILNKPGVLTPEEYEIMKEHPERGYRVLSPIQQLAPASLGVRCHHERIDGGGYPMGLRGSEIPRMARIISVADTYDALTSTRAYRVRRSPDQAFQVIADVSGTQLDPAVVDTLETLIPFIREHEVMIQSGVLEQRAIPTDEAEAQAA